MRVLPGRCNCNPARPWTVPAGRGAEAQAQLAAFVEEMKAASFVAEALTRHRIEGAIVAPAG